KTVTGGHGEKTQRSEGWLGARVGAVSAKMLLVFVLARKRRLDLVTVRAVAERRTPERSGVKKRCAATNAVGGLYLFGSVETTALVVAYGFHGRTERCRFVEGHHFSFGRHCQRRGPRQPLRE